METKLPKCPTNASEEQGLSHAKRRRQHRRKARRPNELAVPRGLLRDPRFRYSFVPAAVWAALFQIDKIDQRWRLGTVCAVAQATIAEWLNVDPSCVSRAEALLRKHGLITADRRPTTDLKGLTRWLKSPDEGVAVVGGFIRVHTKYIAVGGLKAAFTQAGLQDIAMRDNVHRTKGDIFSATAEEVGKHLGRCRNTALKYIHASHLVFIMLWASAAGHAHRMKILPERDVLKHADQRQHDAEVARSKAEIAKAKAAAEEGRTYTREEPAYEPQPNPVHNRGAYILWHLRRFGYPPDD